MNRPVAALVIFRSCLQWKTFQADRTVLFDKVRLDTCHPCPCKVYASPQLVLSIRPAASPEGCMTKGIGCRKKYCYSLRRSGSLAHQCFAMGRHADQQNMAACMYAAVMHSNTFPFIIPF